MVIVIARKTQIKDENENKRFNETFGTFFDDFKENHYREWLFYVLYIIRRVCIFFSYKYVQKGFPQIILPCVTTLTVINIKVAFYIFITKCFKLMICNLYHFIKEMLILAYYIILFICFLSNETMSDQNSYFCIYIITLCWVMNVCFSLYGGGKKIHEKIRNWRLSRRNKKIEADQLKNDASNETEMRFQTN